jgi:hypothetical protein
MSVVPLAIILEVLGNKSGSITGVPNPDSGLNPDSYTPDSGRNPDAYTLDPPGVWGTFISSLVDIEE